MSSTTTVPSPDDVFFEASTLFCAQAKVGKSTLMRHQSYAWALDGHRVVYLSEGSERVWHKRAADLEFKKNDDIHFRVHGYRTPRGVARPRREQP